MRLNDTCAPPSFQENSENLSIQLVQKETEFAEREQQLRQAHQEEVNQLRQEIVTLSIKVHTPIVTIIIIVPS